MAWKWAWAQYTWKELWSVSYQEQWMVTPGCTGTHPEFIEMLQTPVLGTLYSRETTWSWEPCACAHLGCKENCLVLEAERPVPVLPNMVPEMNMLFQMLATGFCLLACSPSSFKTVLLFKLLGTLQVCILGYYCFKWGSFLLDQMKVKPESSKTAACCFFLNF